MRGEGCRSTGRHGVQIDSSAACTDRDARSQIRPIARGITILGKLLEGIRIVVLCVLVLIVLRFPHLAIWSTRAGLLPCVGDDACTDAGS